MNRRARDRRFSALREMGCIACIINANGLWCGKPEVHHLNLGGHAGMKRRGDDATICLGAWHHRGEPPNGMTATDAYVLLGPSLARNSVQFRAEYGVDDTLLAMTDEQLRRIA